jgi:hypothetical protein
VNEPAGPDAVPLSLRVTDPAAWLERHDRDSELHETLTRLLDGLRVAEAVLCLEWHIGRTAPIRDQVAGWDAPAWAMAVAQLSGNRTRWTVEQIQRLLMTTDSGTIERKNP